jgi:protein involved in polysaccharide export with SLBB domain
MRADANVGKWAPVSIGIAACALLLARSAVAQQPDPWDYRAPGLTREQLAQELARYQAAATSPAYSEALRARASVDVDSIRARLADGDMRVGDRLRLVVEGQATLTDSFAVTAGPALILPVVGSVGLKGVLRSELAARLTGRVDSVYRGAVVRVIMLTRVAVLEGVGKPGFYSLPKDALIADVLTAAGGISPTAQLSRIYIERGRSRLWSPDSLQVVMREGRTIGVMGLVDGDRIVVPVTPPGNALQSVQVISYVFSLGLSLLALGRIL